MDRARALDELITSMVDLYSLVDVSDGVKDTLLRLEGVVIRIALQTTECGIFMLHHTSNTGRLFDPSSSRDIA